MRTIFAIFACVITCYSAKGDERSSIGEELERAKSSYAELNGKAAASLLRAFDDSIEKATKKGDFDSVKSIMSDRLAFETDGKLSAHPSIKSAIMAYQQAMKKHRAAMEAAFEKAIRAYTMDKNLVAAEAAKEQYDAFKADPIAANALPAVGIEVIAAFYGQNVSWLDVTDKVRDATNGKDKWAAIVRTEDWGEPAPGFKGPRTLIVRYITEGKTLYKCVYEGERITLP